MDEAAIRDYVAATFPGTDVYVGAEDSGDPEVSWGDTFFIYDPERNLEGARRFPFATIVIKDYPGWDEASNLNRPGVFRLNIGVGKETFARLFPAPAEHDYAASDRLLPHPVYAGNHWVSVINPSRETFASLEPLLAVAYEIAVKRLRPRRGSP